MNKKFILCLALFMGFSLMGPSMSHGQILIKSENVEKNNPKEESFYMDDEYVYLPVRDVTEKLGYSVEYIESRKLVRLIDGNNVTEIYLDTGKFVIDGLEGDLGYKPIIRKGRVFLRVDFFSEVLNCLVTVNSEYTDILVEVSRENDEAFFKKTENEQLEARLDKLIQSYVDRQNFQGSVLVGRNEEVLLAKGYGYSNKDLRVGNKAQTKFPIGSITKQFVGTGIIKLEEAGKLSFDDVLSKHLDGFTYGDEITLDNLLTHRSGLRPVTNMEEFYKLRGQGPQEVVDLIKEEELIFKPGEKFEYNNTNYIVLGMVLESLSGMSLEDYFEFNFFGPLNMLDTGVIYGNKNCNIATPYQGYIDIYEVKEEPLLLNIYGAGNVYSTVEDMYRWNQALKGDEIVSERGKKKLFESDVKMNEEIMYSYGWMLGRDKYGSFYEHDGSTLGFSSISRKNIDDDTTIVILGNRRLEEVFDMAYGIEEVLMGNEVKKDMIVKLPEEVEMTKEEKEMYVGVYSIYNPVNGQDISMEVFLEEDLCILIDGQSKLEIFPKGNNQFFTKRKDNTIVFSSSEGEIFDKVQLSQSGMHYTGYRLGYEGSRMEIDERLLEAYTGMYQIENGLKFSIDMVDGKLYSILSSGDFMELIPVSETKFDFSIGRGSIEFVLDENGQVFKLNYESETNME